jgi:hypothetical protein
MSYSLFWHLQTTEVEVDLNPLGSVNHDSDLSYISSCSYCTRKQCRWQYEWLLAHCIYKEVRAYIFHYVSTYPSKGGLFSWRHCWVWTLPSEVPRSLWLSTWTKEAGVDLCFIGTGIASRVGCRLSWLIVRCSCKSRPFPCEFFISSCYMLYVSWFSPVPLWKCVNSTL